MTAARPERAAGEDPAPALPAWLARPEGYEPLRDHDRFLRKTGLSLAGTLERLRLDDGRETPLSPSAPVKLAIALALVLLTSLARNFGFVIMMLAAVLAREASLPIRALRRSLAVSATAAALTCIVMLPAAFLGQPRSMLVLGAKAFVSSGIVMCAALSTPAHELTGALRTFHVPDEAIMTVELALKSIVDLGRVASQMLDALSLRSVGRDRGKGAALGGVGGMLFLKAGDAARSTSDAMRCRCFEGEYAPCPRGSRRAADAAWLATLAAILAIFIYLEGAL